MEGRALELRVYEPILSSIREELSLHSVLKTMYKLATSFLEIYPQNKKCSFEMNAHQFALKHSGNNIQVMKPTEMITDR